MSENKHTPEFGKASSSKNNVTFSETDDLAAVTAQVIGGNKDVNRLYARRIAACVNSCADFTTEWLERMTREQSIKKLIAEHADMMKQRDELLVALKLVLPMAKGYAAEHQVGSNVAYCEHAEEAIASVECGST